MTITGIKSIRRVGYIGEHEMDKNFAEDLSIVSYHNMLIADSSFPSFQGDSLVAEYVKDNLDSIRSILKYSSHLGQLNAKEESGTISRHAERVI
jgi:hypothetical protein